MCATESQIKFGHPELDSLDGIERCRHEELEDILLSEADPITLAHFVDNLDDLVELCIASGLIEEYPDLGDQDCGRRYDNIPELPKEILTEIEWAEVCEPSRFTEYDQSTGKTVLCSDPNFRGSEENCNVSGARVHEQFSALNNLFNMEIEQTNINRSRALCDMPSWPSERSSSCDTDIHSVRCTLVCGLGDKGYGVAVSPYGSIHVPKGGLVNGPLVGAEVGDDFLANLIVPTQRGGRIAPRSISIAKYRGVISLCH